jgi:hypothetical protein
MTSNRSRKVATSQRLIDHRLPPLHSVINIARGIGALASLSQLVVSDTVALCSNWPAHRRRLGRKCPAAGASVHQILAFKCEGVERSHVPLY